MLDETPAVEMPEALCANPACTCRKPANVERDGRLYCCGRCAAALGASPGECDCGHDGDCGGAEDGECAEGS